MTDHWKEPLPPGVKNLDDFEIHFPNAMKQSDTNYDKDIQVDNVFIEADKFEDRMNALSEEDLPSDDKEAMYNSNPEEWTGYDPVTGLNVENGKFIYDPKDPPTHWELES
tara:strand:- start:188 stop:517 length:330 start_codon:yes stop_codon:yes gene_type:complete